MEFVIFFLLMLLIIFIPYSMHITRRYSSAQKRITNYKKQIENLDFENKLYKLYHEFGKFYQK